MTNRDLSLYSLFHENKPNNLINQIHQYFIGKKVDNLKANKITKDEIISMEAELTDSPTLLADLPLPVALLSIIVAVTSNLYIPYINSLLPPLIKKEEHGRPSSDMLQVLEICIHHLEQLQEIAYWTLIIVVIVMIIKILLSIKKKNQLKALHEYERQLSIEKK